MKRTLEKTHVGTSEKSNLVYIFPGLQLKYQNYGMSKYLAEKCSFTILVFQTFKAMIPFTQEECHNHHHNETATSLWPAVKFIDHGHNVDGSIFLHRSINLRI